jgi:iron complex transport system substrate-binding protein
MFPPERIVCLTEETTETLYLLGEQHRIVGISGYTVRPPQARDQNDLLLGDQNDLSV